MRRVPVTLREPVNALTHRLGVFGFHEVWHLFVLAGATAHFVMMFHLR